MNEITTLRLHGESAADLAAAADLLREGKLVAIPTETVYGLAANALDPAAVEGIFVAKARPHWDPLIVHVSDQAMLERVVSAVSPAARALMDAFWPGPLTLLLPRHAELPSAVTAGRELVGVRIPSHPVAQALLAAAGVPLAAPSANRFGHISPTTAQHVLDDLDGRIHAVLDAGASDIGVESTVFDPAARMLYRQGGISQRQIEDVLKARITVYQRREETQFKDTPESLPSPGVGMRHYAPGARVVLAYNQDDLRSHLLHLPPEQAGVLLPMGWQVPSFRGRIVPWEKWGDTPALARTLYSALRTLDEAGVTTIVCPLPSSSGDPLVEAIRDRLLKAARDV